MGPNENMYEKIQGYLDQSLSATEKAAFEQVMQSDAVLAKEVALNREMQEMFASTAENQLLQNLQRLSSEEIIEPKKKAANWKYWLFLLPLAVLIWGLWHGYKGTTNEMEAVETVESQQKNLDTPDPIIPKKEDGVQTEPIEKVAPPTKTSPPKKKGSPKVKSSEPIAAADFTPNPSLDFLIANNMRDASLVLEVQQKQLNRTINDTDQRVPFELVASITTEENIESFTLKLHLFSNNKADFENFEPLSTFDLAWQPTNPDTYAIDFKQNITLPAGLYYYLIEDFNTEKIYFAEKFEVRLK